MNGFAISGLQRWGVWLLVACLAAFPGLAMAGNGETWTEPITGMEFVRVPGGCFSMGCGFWSANCENDELPLREICVEEFWMGRYEVTQAQWKKVMGYNPSNARGADRPVENVTWREAQEFIHVLNSRNPSVGLRLPEEAQWEYACRGGGRLEKFCGGHKADDVAWHAGNSGLRTHPVGLKAPNGFGLYDMSGNVAEWCQDAWGRDAHPDPASPASSARIGRGGSFGYLPRHVRASFRDWFAEDARYDDLGLRLAISARN